MAGDSAPSSPIGPPAYGNDEKALQFIEETTKNTDRVQEKVLEEILSLNSETEYLRRFGLAGETDRNNFKSKVPVVSYEELKPYIQRIANGDRSPILSSHPISEFFTSSGTSSGDRKLIPITQEEINRRFLFFSLAMPTMRRFVSGLDKGKGLYFMLVNVEGETLGGLPTRVVSTSFYKNEHFKSSTKFWTSPYEAVLCIDSFQSMYTQMLCGLLERDQVLRIGAIFAYSLVQVIRFLQLNWGQLVEDIANGILNPKITDHSIRKYMSKLLQPNIELAQFIRRECEDEKWEMIITRIWPNTKYLDVIVTGTMAQYIPILEYFSGGLPMVSPLYISSECFFALNLNPMCKPSEISYTIMPNMAYFEFLPTTPKGVKGPDDDTFVHDHDLVDLVDVEVGKEYEVVVTNYCGLYRYRVGDILHVTGFHNSAPQFKFMRRANVLLSIDYEKTNEIDLQKAVEKTSVLLREFNTTVADYTSYADTKTIPGHYVIYWELLANDPSNSPNKEVLNRCCLEMEESLDSVYRECRVAGGSIGPLEIRIVKNGTFQELMDYAISRGTAINQYKVPRSVNLAPIIQLLDSKVVSAHFSPGAPHWTLEQQGLIHA